MKNVNCEFIFWESHEKILVFIVIVLSLLLKGKAMGVMKSLFGKYVCKKQIIDMLIVVS
jgi:hypothetical protein